MLHRRRASRIAQIAILALVAIVVPQPAAQAAAGDMTFVGHGWGHGRGMGQYGALGYAVNFGWSSAQILDHFYGGTVAGNAGNPEMTVELMGLTGRDTIVTGSGLAINGVPVGPAALVRRTAAGTFQVYTAPGCGGPWTAKAGLLGSGLTISTPGSQALLGNLVRVCEATGERAYRGSLTVVSDGATQRTINHVLTESYLRGVVPRESPASWGLLAGGKGMQALRAQAVAARSYALASNRIVNVARTCDTTACQVYGGAGFKTGPSLVSLDNGLTDTAISGTAGVVRLKSGAVAQTEFSSSTGGYTAGGTFPAVVDLGDSIASNPNHTWVKTLALSVVAASLGAGPIRTIGVTARNGLGENGGRATNVTVVTTAGMVKNFTGDAVRTKLGLNSDWFSVSGITPAAADQVVRALYRDVLGRVPDAAGLASWTLSILTTGNDRAAARGLVSSRERMNTLVMNQYQSALKRAPDAGELENWVRYLAASGGGLTALQVGIYGSPECLQNLAQGNQSIWVDALYRALLGRDASTSERQYWLAKAALLGRAPVVASIARSGEAGMKRLTAYYTTFLARGVDAGGQRNFLPMMAGRGDFDVPMNLGISNEYWNKAQSRIF
jgi:Stage II sporulation protein